VGNYFSAKVLIVESLDVGLMGLGVGDAVRALPQVSLRGACGSARAFLPAVRSLPPRGGF
jgi:hypothetical protein